MNPAANDRRTPSKGEPNNSTHHLSSAHAGTDSINVEWDQDNQQWWDWYMSLAVNEEDSRQTIELPFPSTETRLDLNGLQRELASPFSVSPDQIEQFQREGFIKLSDVLSADALSTLRAELTRLFDSEGEKVGSRFGSLEMMWETSGMMKAFVMSERLAGIAGQLLQVNAVRLYHDNALSKQPGCGRTPWHYDGHHFPIDSENVATVWVPLQAIPESMGPLAFAHGMDLVDQVSDIPFNKFDTSYDQKLMERFRQTGVPVTASGFDLGEISFHHKSNFHSAGPNRTNIPRMVLATTYFDAGARVIDAPHMVNGDWRGFMPGIEPGDVIDTPLNPILWQIDAQ